MLLIQMICILRKPIKKKQKENLFFKLPLWYDDVSIRMETITTTSFYPKIFLRSSEHTCIYEKTRICTVVDYIIKKQLIDKPMITKKNLKKVFILLVKIFFFK